jgi:GH43 family beta-xylosidase
LILQRTEIVEHHKQHRVGTAALLFLSLLLSLSCGKDDGDAPPPPPPPPPAEETFRNPLITGSDPWVIREDTNYYYTQTLGNRIGIWKTSEMSKLASALSTTVFTPDAGTQFSQNLWAPELHRIGNAWYIYFTAGAGPDSTQRLWVLENTSADPLTGTWANRGRLVLQNADFWAIDATTFEHEGQRYLLWSGRPDNAVQNQNLYIAKMSDALTVASAATKISQPEFLWEINGAVNEAPQILRNPQGRVFVVYSASGCWTDEYALGLLTLKQGGNPLLAADWTKSAAPVFSKKPDKRAFGPGHNAFFTSRDGSENWIIYHANTNSGEGCGEKRNIRMQEFQWAADGTPVFGEPVNINTSLPVPAGE